MNPSHEFDNAVSDFVHTIGLLIRQVRNAAAEHELSWTEGAAMARLEREGPMTTAALARAEGIKPQSMGATVAALEERELIVRKPHPTDGRQVHIELTEKGLDIRKQTRHAKIEWFSHAVMQLDEAEQKTLFAAGDILKRLVSQ